MEQEGKPSRLRKRSSALMGRGGAVVAILAVMLSACTSMEPRVAESTTATGFDRITGHGGGVAIMNSGEYVVIRPDGSLSARCYMCTGSGMSEDACQRTAARRGVPMCHAPANGAATPDGLQPAVSSSPAAQASGAGTPRGGVMCPVYGPSGALAPVLYDPGWPYWCNYQGGAAPSCTCYKMQ